ncbi:acyltransferase family protein [Alteromonas sp. AMM-1]|uniref:acyltransferase family protein n=1 Tax=Alteromonas sp. AMM-1 TaxID=3394233 RepID=UPI0039A6ADB7
MKYRADIDGLRALAVGGVVLFHAFPHKMAGGFTGVDVFFVISGFLISSILFADCAKHSFSFADFYARRVRRIFPALLVVLISCLVFGWFALSANQFQLLGKHALSGLGFIVNFVLVGEAGYFDTAAETKPLLHLWSLAVEEQFYLLWPCLILLTWRRALPVVIVLCIILSFAANLVLVNSQSAGAYFLPFGRFWEMLAGSLLAWVLFKYNRVTLIKPMVANSLSVIGLLCLAGGYLVIDKTAAFPGYWAMLPVVGSICVIAAGEGGLFNRWLLSNPLAVWAGLISYPLYLWHWPVLSFLRILKGSEPGTFELVCAIALSVLLAWLTYNLIEKGVRRQIYSVRSVVSRFVPASAVVATGAALVAFSFVSNYPRITPEKFSQSLTAATCSQIFSEWNELNDNTCRFQQTHNTIAVIGDSHAGHLFDGLAEVASDKGHSVALFPASCQSPLRGVSSGYIVQNTAEVATMRENGHKLISQALDYVLESDHIQSVVLAHSPRCDTSIKDVILPHSQSYQEILANGFQRTLTELQEKDKQVLIVLDNPFLKSLPNRCLKSRLPLYSKRESCIESEEEHRSNELVNTYNKVVASVAAQFPNVTVIDLASILCENGQCTAVVNDKLLYKDQSHLSVFGSRYVAPYIFEALDI